MTWFWRVLCKVSCAPVIAFGVLAIALSDTVARGDAAAWAVLAVSFTAGAAAILTEIIIAWRKGTLFIRDRTVIEERRARNMRLARVSLGPAVAIVLLLGFFTGTVAVALLGLVAGYLVPFSLALVVHFAKNHREIERLTT